MSTLRSVILVATRHVPSTSNSLRWRTIFSLTMCSLAGSDTVSCLLLAGRTSLLPVAALYRSGGQLLGHASLSIFARISNPLSFWSPDSYERSGTSGSSTILSLFGFSSAKVHPPRKPFVVCF